MNLTSWKEALKEYDIHEWQLSYNHSSTFSYRLYHGELDKYTVSSSKRLSAQAFYQGHFVTAYSEDTSKEGLKSLVKALVNAASISETEAAVGLYPGSPHYKKRKVNLLSLENMTSLDKISLGKKVESYLEKEEGVEDVMEIAFQNNFREEEVYNSFGLKLKNKSGSWFLSAVVSGKDGERSIDMGDVAYGEDFSSFDPQKFAAHIGEELRKKKGATSYPSGKYPVVINREIFATFVNSYINCLSSVRIQKHTSPLEGKKDQKVASSRLTIEERPLDKTIFFESWDDELVAKKNLTLVKNGVIKEYLYNRETAKKDGVETNAHGVIAGGKVDVASSYLKVRPGKGSLSDLVKPIKQGVYITDIAGYGTGLNAYNGDFSCQAQGFAIENGEITRPLTLITLSGNLLSLMRDIKAFDSESKENLNGICCPNVYIKKMSIGGE